MKFSADLHIHSHYSLATSGELQPPFLDYWARLKGLTVVASGDFTHPGWSAELQQQIEPAEEGLFRLKPGLQRPLPSGMGSAAESPVRFVLSAEISTIYRKNDKTRKVHHVVLAPDFTAVRRIQESLVRLGGNITSDGRPVLGLDSRTLLEICLQADERIVFIPAHIWTPWFSALGDKSGFDTIAECYEDLTPHIFAVETGLSSDPPMNRLCSFLDSFTLVSNSDAHSPEKLGRECNLFDTELSYPALRAALQGGRAPHYLGTVEFFPEEGKYHFDGHRKCGVLWDPLETLKHRGICPQCGKKITVGVMNRVARLADREDPGRGPRQSPFHSLVPLKEILAEILDVGPQSGKVEQAYMELLRRFGPELDILLRLEPAAARAAGQDELAEALERMRGRRVVIEEGYDGEYGRIRLFAAGELTGRKGRRVLFAAAESAPQAPPERPPLPYDLPEYRRLSAVQTEPGAEEERRPVSADGLNARQRQAVEYVAGPSLIIAGPGTGKTRVITAKIAHLLRECRVPAEAVLAVTFTNKAAGEMAERLRALLPESAAAVTTATFHALGHSILREHAGRFGRRAPFTVIDEEDRRRILADIVPAGLGPAQAAAAIVAEKQQLRDPEHTADSVLAEVYRRYEEELTRFNAFDLEDLVRLPAQLLQRDEAVGAYYRERFRWVLIDEYQDINFAQYRLVRTLMPGPAARLCAVGDPNQAIYGFRGADVAFIRRFRDDYPDSAVFHLTASYRCSDTILQASHGIVAAGEDALSAGVMLQGVQRGVKIRLVRQPTDRSEAEFVARTIERMIGGLRFFSLDSAVSSGEHESGIGGLGDFAVLCRLGRQMEAVEKALADHGIPWQKAGEQAFFQEEPARLVLAALGLCLTPGHPWLREKVRHGGVKEPDTLAEALSGAPTVAEKIALLPERLFRQRHNEHEAVFRRLQELAAPYGADLEGFLRFTALGGGIDAHTPRGEQVNLLTLHAAKGLEFPCVFIVGCEEGLLPYALFAERAGDVQEERRLLYVGMTRAQRHLFLCHAERRVLFGREYRLPRSSFLDRVEKDLFELEKAPSRPKKEAEGVQLSLFDPPPAGKY